MEHGGNGKHYISVSLTEETLDNHPRIRTALGQKQRHHRVKAWFDYAILRRSQDGQEAYLVAPRLDSRVSILMRMHGQD
jgi:hypothetical protein